MSRSRWHRRLEAHDHGPPPRWGWLAATVAAALATAAWISAGVTPL